MKATASGLWLLEHCAWWARPEVPAAPRTESTHQNFGEAGHQACEMTIGGHAVDVAWLAEKHGVKAADLRAAFETWLAWWREQSADGWRAEVSVAWDAATDTAREDVSDGHRVYKVGASEIPGTMDAVQVAAGHVRVMDWKFGDDWQEYTPDAEENVQLALYGLSMARAHEVESVTVEVVRVTSEGVVVDARHMDAVVLDATAATLRRRLATIPDSRPTPGAHCGRCPAAAVCPVSHLAAQSLALWSAPVPLVVDAPETAGALHERIAIVEAALKQAKAAVAAWGADGGELALSDGRRLALKEQKRREIVLTGQEGAEAQAVLAEFGAEAAIEQPPPTITWEGVERALKARGVKVAPARRELTARLAQAHAIREKSHGSRWLPTNAPAGAEHE